jgi:protein required for attachment to host cells
MPMKPKITWIVLADGMHARVLRQDKYGAPLVPALDRELYEPEVHKFSRDLRSDAPGRTFDSVSSVRHAMEPRTDPKTHEKQLFARRVADLINTAAAQQSFDQLVLVAPPKTLGELRAHLDPHAKRLVIGEVVRDLLKTPAEELPAHLTDVLAHS